MRNPLESLSPEQRTRWFYPLLAATLLVMLALNLEGRPLITPAAPAGIVSYELAGTVEKAQEILTSWNEHARIAAGFSLGFDYLFMVLYSTAIALGCIMAGGILKDRRLPLGKFGRALAWGQWLAAIFDGIENLALSVILFSIPAAPWPAIARICAILKFGLILIGLLYVLLGLAAHLFVRKTRTAVT